MLRSQLKNICLITCICLCGFSSYSQLVLVAGTEFEPTTVDATKDFYGIDEIEQYGFQQGGLSVNPPLTTSTNADVFHNTFQYAVTDNPFKLDNVRYGDVALDDWGLVISPATSRVNIFRYSLTGLKPNSQYRVEVEYYNPISSANASCVGNVSSFKLVGNPNAGQEDDGEESDQIRAGEEQTQSWDQDDNVSNPVDLNGNLDVYINVIRTDDCSPLVIKKIEIYAEPLIQIKSSQGDEVCQNEQTILSPSLNYNTTDYQWERSSNGGITFSPISTERNILEEVGSNMFYRLFVDGILSEEFEVSTVRCCEITPGVGSSREQVYFDDFGRYIDSDTYEDAFGTITTGLPKAFRSDVPYTIPGHTFDGTGSVNDGSYTVSSNIDRNVENYFNTVTEDHSGELNGGYLLINVATNYRGRIYDRQIDNLCPDKELYLEAFLGSATRDNTNPQIDLKVFSADGLTELASTGDIEAGPDDGWIQAKLPPFVLSGASSIRLVIESKATSWSDGNDLVLDDIRVLSCVPPAVDLFSDLDDLVQDTIVCNDPITLDFNQNTLISNFYNNPNYLYQFTDDITDDNSWENIGSPSTISEFNIADPKNSPYFSTSSDDDVVYFRVITAEQPEFTANSDFMTPNNADPNDFCRNYSISDPIALTLNCPACNKPDAVSITNGSSVTQCLNTALDLSGSFIAGSNPIKNTMNFVWYKEGTTIGTYSPTLNTTPSIANQSFPGLVSADSGTWVLRVEDGTAGDIQCYTEAEIEVGIHDIPTATLSGDTSICNEVGVQAMLSVEFTGAQPWTLVYNDPQDGDVTLTPNPTTSPTTINVSNNGAYSLVSVSDANCPGTVSGSAQLDYHEVIASSSSLRCSDDSPLGTDALASDEFQIVVTVTSGDLASVNITETTSVGGITFTRDGTSNNWFSSPIDETNTVDINVTDANDCNGGVDFTGLTESCSCPASADVFFGTTGTLLDSICDVASTTLTVNPTGGAGNYNITVTQPDNVPLPVSTNVASGNIDFVVSQEGVYTVSVQSIGDANCQVPGNTVTVGHYKNPTINFEDEFKICADSTDTLDIEINVTSESFPVDIIVGRTTGGDTTITMTSNPGTIPGTILNEYTITSIEDANGCFAQPGDITGNGVKIDTVSPPHAGILSVDGDEGLQINMTSFKEKFTNATMVEVVADSINEAFIGTWTIDGLQGDTVDTKQDTVSVMGLEGFAMLPDTSFGDTGITRLVYSVVDTAGVCDAVTDTLKIIKVEGGPQVMNYDINICTDSMAFTQNGRPLITGIESGLWVDIDGIIPTAPADDTIRSNDISFPSNIPAGSYTFHYIVRSILDNVEDQLTIVTLNVSALPSVADVSNALIETCDVSTRLNGIAPSPGTGVWTKVSGVGNLLASDIARPDALVEGLQDLQSGVFRWTVSNGACLNKSFDDVTLTKTGKLTPAVIVYGGNPIRDDSTITLCSNANETISNQGFAIGETGMWSIIDPVSAPRSVTINEDDSQTQPLVLNANGLTTLQWQITDPTGVCDPNVTTVNVNVVEPPNPMLDMMGRSDTTICFGNTLNILTTNLSGGSYQWFVNNIPVASQTNPNYELVGTAAEYRFEESNGFCSISTLPIRVIVDIVPEVDAGAPIVLEEDDERFLNGSVDVGVPTWSFVSNSTGLNIIDNPGDLNSKILSTNTGGVYRLMLTAVNNNCISSDETTVTIRTKVKAPNVFTPNGDGEFDLFIVEGLETYPTSKLYVYSRWGRAVYISPTDNYNDELWDGGDLPEGIYYYVIDLGLGKENGHSGVIHLLR